MRSVFLATICIGLAATARAQQTPSQEPLPANPVPVMAEDESLLPEEIMLVPQLPPPRAGETPGKLPPYKLKLEAVEIEPLLPPMATGFADTGTLASALRVHAKRFRFEGNTVFSDRELAKVVARFAGREISSTELEEARQALSLYYVEHGFINSGALLPDQDLQDGIVAFQIVEGRLTDIELRGNWWFRAWWLRHEMRRAAGRPLNFNRMKEGLQLLRENPNIRQINAELLPGGKPGESMLKVTVEENQPFRLSLDFSNRRPPSVGAEILEVNVSDLNLSGHNDPIWLRYGILHATSETPDHWEGSGTDNIEGSYRIPVSPWHTTLEFHASRNDAAIVEEQFQPLDITSESEQYGVTLRQPFYESLTNEFAVALTADKRKNTSFVLHSPFTLSPGAIDGETEVFVLRLALEYVNRSQQHVLALRSTFNWGVNELNATRHANGLGSGIGSTDGVRKLPDGQFFAWLGQAQYVRRLFNTDRLAVVRINAQLANDPLLSLEQYSLGGAQSVRGYRENQILRDNGVFGSLEVRLPVWRNKEKNPIVTFAPFFDIGAAWDRTEYIGAKPSGGADDRLEILSSVGAGVILTPWKHVNAQLYWGYALNQGNKVKGGDNLQDYG
ncbi:MAG TPA: ShlB/FhaC/HecB family hemolysin secretion/activation protein, partial [Chthoniobacteraceae bacterium]|nr:ShlB/FhaC/HecB family hemolysin secretion/activation protein [Chthoniobacteraceae bacterium]